MKITTYICDVHLMIQRRHELLLSAEELAKESGVGVSTINNLERNAHEKQLPISLKVAKKLINVLGKENVKLKHSTI